MNEVDRFFQRGLKLSHLRILTMFAALGQIRLVAERLHITQPAVSKQLADLEEGLGAPVVRRVGNRLQFTPMGDALLQRAREIFLQLEQARHEVDAFGRSISGTISVGAVATVMPTVGPTLTLKIKQRAPNAGVRFFEATSDKLFPRLSEGTLDLVFSRTRPPGNMSGLVGEPVFDDPIVIVCGSDNPLASRRGLKPADLAGLPWILPPPEAPTAVALAKWMTARKLTFAPGCIESISLSVNERLLKEYPFLGLMPQSVAHSASQRSDIKILRFAGASFLGTVFMFRRQTDGSRLVAEAIECVAQIRGVFSAAV